MAPDEIGGRGDREPWMSRRWAVVALVAAGIAGLAASERLTAGDEASRPSPSALPSSAAPVLPPTAPSAVWVENDAVCPVQTDGLRFLVVRFILANRSDRDLAVDSVEPLLPLGGLVSRSISTVAGDCHRWVPTDSGDSGLPSGASRVVSMIFDLPETCPHPLPIQARVRVRAGAATRTTDLHVLDDLSGVAFDSCPGQ